MHELSIAMNIVEIARQNAIENQGRTIKEIEIEVGDLSGVIHDSLEFAMEMTVKNSILEKSEIIIKKVAAKAKCKDCDAEFELNDHYFPCPECGSYYHHLLKGNELSVKSILFS